MDSTPLALDQTRLEETRGALHEHCVVCWDRHPFGLKVAYRAVDERTVEGTFACGKSYEGYADVLHGGIVAGLLDGAMANCLLAMGVEAYTVDLRLRFRGAVRTGEEALIRGHWVRSAGPLHLLQATLSQGGKPLVSARAKFFKGRPGPGGGRLAEGTATRELIRASMGGLR
nr:PaaI family thioesterase [uncultured Holophaga sp.]